MLSERHRKVLPQVSLYTRRSVALWAKVGDVNIGSGLRVATVLCLLHYIPH